VSGDPTALATGHSTSVPALPDPAEFTGKLSDLARDYVVDLRAGAEQAVWAGESGWATALRITAGVDALVRFVVEATSQRFAQRYARGAPQRCAVIAQGGYGRCDMSPHSDVDLLIMYPGRMSPYVETITERLIQTLFDGQLQVGWAVRTPRDCVDQAERDVTIKTTMLDGRLIAGAAELGSQFTEAVQDVLVARDPQRFAAAKRAEFDERHARFGGSVFLLEPNVKEGEGGLRDLHTLLWIGRVLRGIVRLEDLTASGLASETEERELLAARDFLLRVRHALHALARCKQDKLGFESQE
jgi:[protein-PII] uridylyltransferase